MCLTTSLILHLHPVKISISITFSITFPVWNSIQNSSNSEEVNGVIIPKKTINELFKLLSERTDDIEIEIN